MIIARWTVSTIYVLAMVAGAAIVASWVLKIVNWLLEGFKQAAQ